MKITSYIFKDKYSKKIIAIYGSNANINKCFRELEEKGWSSLNPQIRINKKGEMVFTI